MSGWKLKEGKISDAVLDENIIRSKFNYVFSDSCSKRNTYKFGLIKSLLDSLLDGTKDSDGIRYTYEELFSRFAENYWNLVVKYNLRQTRKDGKSDRSKIEIIFEDAVSEYPGIEAVEFETIADNIKQKLIKKVAKECKKYVVGALYKDFDGTIYSFNLKNDGVILNNYYYDFMLKYKLELERLNYYSWAKFLEQINDESVLAKVIDKLELSTPKRNDLSVYREILRNEFEENTCFYCGKKLGKEAHVDHFIPWSFVKDDKIWNFVLACPKCNIRKSNKLPNSDYLDRIKARNIDLQGCQLDVVVRDCQGYTDDFIAKIWNYARLSGLKEMGIIGDNNED